MCHVCFGQIQFEKLPDENKRSYWAAVVPERFIEAMLDDLARSLREAVIADTDSGLLLWGPPGVGKTYALCAAAKHFLSEGYIVKRTNYELLCLRLRDTFKPSSKQSEWEVIEPLLNCDKLIIEDIGTTKSIDSKESDFSLRTLLLLLDMRLENCKPTYITTNKTVENLQSSFDARVGDRLGTFNIIQLRGKSKRAKTVKDKENRK